MTTTCTRIIGWDMGHRVYKHESKCSHPHGHRYTAEVTATAPGLDAQGRVIVFSVLKAKIGGWIDANWDHGFMLFDKDPAFAIMRTFPDVVGELRVFTVPFNPTAENIAAYLGEVVCPLLMKDTGILISHIRLYETPNGYVDWVFYPKSF
jgi:6-pyruvoyltetrahydropterin/6-carboxytetrahydropterin synthase